MAGDDAPAAIAPDVHEVSPRAQSSLAAAASQPLNKRRIIVTSPRQYASKLCALLVAAGARPMWLPSIEITALSDAADVAALDAALDDLSAYSHIAFTSKNGIQAVIQRLEEAHPGRAAEAVRASGIKVCALGADGEALLSSGFPVDVLPAEASTRGLVAELVSRGEADGARVLCPTPKVTGGLTEPAVVPRFLAMLEEAGAAPVRVDAYVTQQGMSPADVEAEAALMRGGCVDAVVFTSTAEAQGLVHALGGADVLQDVIHRQGIVLAAHGPYTAAGVTSVTGLEVECIGRDFATFNGVVMALEEHFSARR